MHKNNFCAIPNKALIYEDIITMSQSTIYKKNENEINKNKNIKKLKKRFFNKDFKHQNNSYLSIKTNESQYVQFYILSKNILKKYTNTYIKKVNIGLSNINNLIYNKKCHFTVICKESIIFNSKIEYIKKYYKYNESIKIIPKREVYFKHLMQFLERPFFKNFNNNKIIKQIGLEKLSIYRRTNYPKKLNKNLNLNNNICNNIIFNPNVIETIENCSTSMTQNSNRNNQNLNENNINHKIKPKNNCEKDASIISEIKVNNCSYKKNDNNISCIDNSLLIIMKDLSISQNKINAYLCQHNTNYKNLYYKVKNKAKIHATTNKNDKDEKNKVEEKEKKFKEIKDMENNINKKIIQTKKLNNINHYKKMSVNKQNHNNIIKYKIQKNSIENEICHNSVSSHKKINNIPIIPFNSNNLNSQINNKNSCCNTKKYCLSSFPINKSIKIHNLKKKFKTNKIVFNENNQNLSKYFNSYSSKEKNSNNLNLINFLKNNKILSNINNQDILKKIKKIVEKKEPKNKSMKKNINTQKLLTDYSLCMLDSNSLNENETKRKYQTINAVKSISISNNQFFNQRSEFKKIDYK